MAEDPTIARVTNLRRNPIFQTELTKISSAWEKELLQAQPEEFTDDFYSRKAKISNASVYEKPRESTEKSMQGWLENLAADAHTFATGIYSAFKVAIESGKEIVENIEYLPMIFNEAAPHEARTEHGITKHILGGLWDWVDNFELGKEIRFTADQMGKAIIEPYQDGLVEAAYKHPFTMFLDLTAVASVLGKGISTAGRVAARTVRSSARKQIPAMRAKFMERGLTGQRLEDAMATADRIFAQGAYQRMRGKGDLLGKRVANSPYLPFTGPMKYLDKQLTTKLKDAMPGKAYTSLKKGLLLTKASIFGNRTLGSMGIQAENAAKVMAKKILGKLGRLSPGEINFFYDRLLMVDELAKWYPQPGVVKRGQYGTITEARKKVLDESVENYRRWASESEDIIIDAGLGTAKDLKKSRATTALNHVALKQADAEISGLGHKVSKADREGIYLKHRDRLLGEGSPYIEEMLMAIAEVEKRSGGKLLPYHPFVAQRKWAPDEFIETLLKADPGSTALKEGQWEHRFGKGMVEMDPNIVVLKHITQSERVRGYLGAVNKILKKEGIALTGTIADLRKSGKIPEGWERFEYKFLLDKYLPTEIAIQSKIAYNYEFLVRELIKDGKTPKVAQLEAAGKIAREVATTADGILSQEAIHKTFTDYIQNPKTYNTHIYVPSEINKLLEHKMRTTTGLVKLYQGGMNAFRFMVLNLYPRFYINNMVGNSLLNVFSGSTASKYLNAGNRHLDEVPELLQSVWNQGISGSLPYRYSNGALSKAHEFFQRNFEGVPRAALFAKSVEELAVLERMSKSGAAAMDAMTVGDDLLGGVVNYARKEQWTAAKEGVAARKIANEAQKVLTRREKVRGKLELLYRDRARLHVPDVTTRGKLIIEELARTEERVAKFRDRLAELGMSKHSKFMKMVDDMADDPAMVDTFHNYIRSGEAAEDIIKSLGTKKFRGSEVKYGGVPIPVDRLLNNLERAVARTDNKLKKLTAQDGYIRTGDHRGIPERWMDEVLAEQRQLQDKARKLDNKIARGERALGELDPLDVYNKLIDQLREGKHSRKLANKAQEIFDGALKKMETFYGNYNAMHPLERSLVRNWFPFWTFPKTMVKLMFKYPGIRPKTAALWAHYSKYMADATESDNLPPWLRNSVVVGGHEDGTFTAINLGSWNILDAAGTTQFMGLPFPRAFDPVGSNPFIRFAIEGRLGKDTFTMKPVERSPFLSNDGLIYEPDPATGGFRKRTPRKGFVDALTTFIPQITILREILDPNYKVPQLPTGEYLYDRKRWMAIPRLLGIQVTVSDKERLKAMDIYHRHAVWKKIRMALKHGDPEDQATAEAVWKYILENDSGQWFMQENPTR